ncbi:ABC transporter substrate-binding protein [Nitriliruptoraceae bacterium ZYF776]|nr:ABC transporter substrate-binding protein [Profundirhabdus halotolerans]
MWSSTGVARPHLHTAVHSARGRAWRLAAAAAVALLAAACNGGGEDVDLGDAAQEDPGGDADGGEPTEGGTLVAGIGGDPDQLDPHATTSSFSFTVLENVYDTLVQPNAELEMEPALATEWETSDDLLTWTFQLREGVTFHDGSDFTAEDVVASLTRIQEEGQNSFRLDPVTSIEATGDLEVTLELERPAPNLLAQLGAFKGMAIVSADDIEAGTLSEEPNGTGPFAFESRADGDSLTLSANGDYWGEQGPFLDGLEFRIIPDEGVKLTNLETGEVDWIDSVPPQDVEGLGGDDLTVQSVPANDYWYVSFNNDREPFDDPLVRQAIAYAVDIDELTEAVKFDAATPNETAIPESSVWYHDYAPFGTDLDQAQTLLDEAGVDGFSMDLMVTDEFPETIAAAEVLANQLDPLGIDVQIRTEEFNTWLADQGEGDFDAFALGWLGNIDPDDFYYAQHHSDGVNNFQGFADDEVDQLLDAAREEPDEDERKSLYDQAAERIVDQVSYLYLYNPDLVQAWSPTVTGYEARADQATRFVTTQLGS